MMRPAVNQPLDVGRGGMFLPKLQRNTRILAENSKPEPLGMDSSAATCTMKTVVLALPLGALFASLYRYPSPIGRLCFIPSQPSIFPFSTMNCEFRRQIAQPGSDVRRLFVPAAKRRMCRPTPLGNSTRGDRTCLPSSNSLWRCWGFADLRPVGTQVSSRHLSVPEQAQVRRPSWMVTSLPVPQSVLRATSFTARPTNANAAERRAVLRGDARLERGRANAPQWGSSALPSHLQRSAKRVCNTQWGASNQRGAQYGLYQSSTSFVCARGVCRARSVEPHGLRPLCADTANKLTPFGALPRAVRDLKPMTKRTTCESGPCALSFSTAA